MSALQHVSDPEPQFSGNPIFPGWYADPELHLFAGRFYLYPTYSANYNDQTFFEAWSSSDLTDWRNDGRILDFADVPWSTNRCAWAPSIIERHGRYFFYFSAGDGAGLGVAVADHPDGPFADALGKPLVATYPHGAQPIDAHVFLDEDGQAYLYFGGWSHAVVVKLAEDMITLDGDFLEITPEHYVEGPFMLKRRGVYYFMWSEGGWGDESYAVAYAKSDFPRLARSSVLELFSKSDPAVGTSAGHHSVLNYLGTDDWYIAYHRRPLTETEANHRIVCIDRLYFDQNGDILPVVLTNEGVPARPLPERLDEGEKTSD